MHSAAHQECGGGMGTAAATAMAQEAAGAVKVGPTDAQDEVSVLLRKRCDREAHHEERACEQGSLGGGCDLLGEQPCAA